MNYNYITFDQNESATRLENSNESTNKSKNSAESTSRSKKCALIAVIVGWVLVIMIAVGIGLGILSTQSGNCYTYAI